MHDKLSHDIHTMHYVHSMHVLHSRDSIHSTYKIPHYVIERCESKFQYTGLVRKI